MDNRDDLIHNMVNQFKVSGNKLPVDTELTATIDPTGLATSAKQDTLAGVVALEATQIAANALDLSAAGITPLSYDASAKTAALTAGWYAVHVSTACHVRTGPQASAAATTSEKRWEAGDSFLVKIDGTNDTIAAIKNTIAGTLTAQRVK